MDFRERRQTPATKTPSQTDPNPQPHSLVLLAEIASPSLTKQLKCQQAQTTTKRIRTNHRNIWKFPKNIQITSEWQRGQSSFTRHLYCTSEKTQKQLFSKRSKMEILLTKTSRFLTQKLNSYCLYELIYHITHLAYAFHTSENLQKATNSTPPWT